MSEFDTSAELKQLFNKQFETWKRRTGMGLEDLAQRCGVSSSYLSHVGRYGRVPGKPILLLLALNFELKNPQDIYNAAGVKDDWPYEETAAIGGGHSVQPGFLTVQVDMPGFTEAIRSIVKAEIRPRTIQDLTRGRALRIGYNQYQRALVGKSTDDPTQPTGFFQEFVSMLALTLRCRVEMIEVPYSEYRDWLDRHDIDLFGPKILKPQAYAGLVSDPFCRVGLSTLVRKLKTDKINPLPPPKSLKDLQTRPYKIAVLRNSRSHLFANVALKRSDEDLLLCETIDEAVERITLSGMTRLAHVLVISAPTAILLAKQSPDRVAAAFTEKGSFLEVSDDCLVVRSDWPELIAPLNQSIQYLMRTGSLEQLMQKWVPPQLNDAILLP